VQPLDLPVIDSFSANERYVAPGTTVNLEWATSDATTVSLSSEGSPVAASGSLSKVIDTTTTFTLTASKPGGTVEQSIKVFAVSERPNIVLFLVDDMGPMDTSVPFIFDASGNPLTYNFNDLYVTPHMESMAANGMRFSRAYAQPTCSPTRVSLMTGLNTTGHAVTSWVKFGGANQGEYSPTNYRSGGMEDPDEETLPKWLSAAGYRTIHVGKGHFTYQHGPAGYDEIADPRFIGFDVNIGGGSMGQPGSYLGTDNYINPSAPLRIIPGVEEFYGTNTFLTEALTIKANQEISTTVESGQPFFLYMSHYAIHAPFQEDPRATGDYSALSDSDRDFATMIEGMDLSLGEIIAHLEAEDIAEETLIIFMGDNGSDNRLLRINNLPEAPYDDYPLRGMKGDRSEGGSRVPLMVAWAKPDAAHPLQQALPIPANSVESDIVPCWDIPVTIMSVAGVDIPESAHIHGQDLSPYLSGIPGTHREQQMLIYFPNGRVNNDHFGSYYEGDWKLIYLWEEERFRLYDLANDPTENTDLAASRPEKLLQMARGMARQFDQEWGTTFGTLWPTYPAPGEGEFSTAAVMGTLDLDGDGIPDADEDVNANGLIDPGETAPDKADSDEDGTDDFSEVRLGLDPLKPGSYFRSLIGSDPAGGRTLSWPSQPGLSFRIHHSSDLTAPMGTWTTVSGIPAAAASSETTWTYNGSENQRFFIIELD
jgi:arylsulfatase A-like enzyme